MFPGLKDWRTRLSILLVLYAVGWMVFPARARSMQAEYAAQDPDRPPPVSDRFMQEGADGIDAVNAINSVQKTASLFADADGSGTITPGDTLLYTIVISNGSGSAKNAVFTDTPGTN